MFSLLKSQNRSLCVPRAAFGAAIVLLSACSESSPPQDPTGNSGTLDGGGADPGIPPVPTETGNHPLAALQGDYLRRVDTRTHAENSVLGTVNTDASSLGVVRVVLQGDQLVGVERLCHYLVTQDAELGTLTTTISSVTWPNLDPVTRQLDVDLAAGTWSSPPATRRQGFRASAAALPTDPVAQADDLLDPDEDGTPGVTTRVTGQVSIVTADCKYAIVSASTTKYVAGTLDGAGNKLAGANVAAVSAESHAFSAEQAGGNVPCDAADINEATAPTIDSDVLRLTPVAGGWLAQDDACPSVAEFEAALP